MSEKTYRQNVNAAYATAIRSLKTNHEVEFNKILSAVYAERGLTVKRRATADEKLESQFRAAEAVILAHGYIVEKRGEDDELATLERCDAPEVK